jgi:hypothetical protein
MLMPMMQIREMRVRVHQPAVPVAMRVGFARWIAGAVVVPVVLVVDVAVFVLQRVVDVFVFVAFGDVEKDAGGHEERGGDELRSDSVV